MERTEAETIESLKRDVSRLQQVLDGRVDAEFVTTYLKSVFDTEDHPHFQLDIRQKLPAFAAQFFGEMLALAIGDATNYVTSTMILKGDKYELTIRRTEGLTPLEKMDAQAQEHVRLQERIAALEAELETARASVATMRDALESARWVIESQANTIVTECDMEKDDIEGYGMTQAQIGRALKLALPPAPNTEKAGLDSVDRRES